MKHVVTGHTYVLMRDGRFDVRLPVLTLQSTSIFGTTKEAKYIRGGPYAIRWINFETGQAVNYRDGFEETLDAYERLLNIKGRIIPE